MSSYNVIGILRWKTRSFPSTSNDCQSLYGSPGAAWQDKSVGRCKMDQQNPSYISCMEHS